MSISINAVVVTPPPQKKKMVCSRMYSQCMLKYFIQQIFLDISAKALSIKSFKSNVTTRSRANFEYVCLQYTYTLYLERDIIQFSSSQYRGLQNKINCWCFKLWSTFLESGQVHVTEFTVNISDYVMCHALKKKITLVFVFRWKLLCHNLLKAYTSNPWT